MKKSAYLAIIVVIISVLVYKFNSIQLPEGYESPTTVKLLLLTFNTIGKIARIIDAFGVKPEPLVVKSLSKNQQFKMLEDSNLKVEEVMINNIPALIYQPISKINENNPVIIYYHGSGFVYGSAAMFDAITHNLAKKLNIKVISIDYRLAPENKYPIPINDCIETTEYILDNAEKYKIDVNRVVLAGDSAGGNIVAVITQRFAKKGKNIPKLQVLIYPWIQQFNFRLPSYLHYFDNKLYGIDFDLNKCILWYLGIEYVTDEMILALRSNNHTFLLDDATRLKYAKYVDTDLIPKEYKTASYYQNYKKIDFSKNELDANNILVRDKMFATEVIKVFNKDVSPGLADDEELKSLPKAYVLVTEMDELKDEALIYAQRLRNNGVPVHISYFEKSFHGGLMSITEFNYNEISIKMLDDIIDYIKNNI